MFKKLQRHINLNLFGGFMEYIIAIVLGYLLGCSNMAFYISKFKKIDLRKEGSGNLGTSNTVTEVGFKAGLLVFFHDVFKAVIAILLMKLIFPDAELSHYVAGFAAILGHIFPFYTKFKGGKGFATYVGVVYALHPIFALCITPVIIGIILFTDYIIAGTFGTAIAFSIYIFAVGNWEAGILSLVILLVIVFKHIDNFKRIFNGTEKGVMAGLRGKKKQPEINETLTPAPSESENEEEKTGE